MVATGDIGAPSGKIGKGEAGMGFAVVADKVCNLAQHGTQAGKLTEDRGPAMVGAASD